MDKKQKNSVVSLNLQSKLERAYKALSSSAIHETDSSMNKFILSWENEEEFSTENDEECLSGMLIW